MAFVVEGLKTVFTAFSFAGGSALFNMIIDHGESEIKRHNHAMELERRALDNWEKQRQERLDMINQRLQLERKATKYIKNLDDGIRAYYEATKQRLPPLPPRPQLTDFYTPSQPQKDAEIAFITIAIIGVGYLGYKYIK